MSLPLHILIKQQQIMAIFSNSKVESKSWMIDVSTQVTNIKKDFPFPAIPVRGQVVVWAKGEHHNQYGTDVADWEFALNGKEHSQVMEALTLFISAEEYTDLREAIEAELSAIAIDSIEYNTAPAKTSAITIDNAPALVEAVHTAEDFMNRFSIREAIQTAVEDARIAENVDLDVSMNYGRDFVIEVDYDNSGLIRDIANCVEEYITDTLTK